MGAEESTLYPAQQQTNAAGAQSGYVQTGQQVPMRRHGATVANASTFVPQPVLLVGYTPDGSPILMANPSQNSIASITATNRSNAMQTSAPMLATQTPVAATVQPASHLQTAIPLSTQTNMDAYSTILHTQTPVMAVPKTIYGPDGKLYTALVKPTSSSGTLLNF